MHEIVYGPNGQEVGTTELPEPLPLPVPMVIGTESGARIRPASLRTREEDPVSDWRAASINGYQVVVLEIWAGYYITDVSVHRRNGEYSLIMGMTRNPNPSCYSFM